MRRLKKSAVSPNSQEVGVTKKGETLVRRAVTHQTLDGVMKAFASFPASFMAMGRVVSEQSPRVLAVKAQAAEPVAVGKKSTC